MSRHDFNTTLSMNLSSLAMRALMALRKSLSKENLSRHDEQIAVVACLGTCSFELHITDWLRGHLISTTIGHLQKREA